MAAPVFLYIRDLQLRPGSGHFRELNDELEQEPSGEVGIPGLDQPMGHMGGTMGAAPDEPQSISGGWGELRRWSHRIHRRGQAAPGKHARFGRMLRRRTPSGNRNYSGRPALPAIGSREVRPASTAPIVASDRSRLGVLPNQPSAKSAFHNSRQLTRVPQLEPGSEIQLAVTGCEIHPRCDDHQGLYG